MSARSQRSCDEERGVLWRDSTNWVIWDVHELGGALPRRELGGFQRQLGLDASEGFGVLGLETPHHRDRIAKVETGHQVGEGVVVDHRRVLVGSGDTVDVKAAVLTEESEVRPHPRRLDEDLGAGLDEEVDIAAYVDVATDCRGDVSVEVELGGAGQVVRRRLIARDRPPRKERSPQVHVACPLACLGQHAVAEPKQVPGDPRLGVGEERQHPRLGVPEVMAVVGVAGEALGRDPRPFGTPGCLGEMEQVPPHRLLHAHWMPDRVLEGHVGPIPEAIQAGPLGGQQLVKTCAGHPTESPPAAGSELGGGHGARRLVRGELRHPDRNVRFCVDGHNELRRVRIRHARNIVRARHLDDMVHTNAERHPTPHRLVAEHQTVPIFCYQARLEDPRGRAALPVEDR